MIPTLCAAQFKSSNNWQGKLIEKALVSYGVSAHIRWSQNTQRRSDILALSLTCNIAAK